MKRILVFKDVAYASKVGGGTIANLNELNLLATGAMAIYHKNGLVDITAPDFADVKEFYIAVGAQTADVKVRKSQVIQRHQANVETCPYAAAVAEIQYVGNDLGAGALNLPGTLVEGTEAEVNIMPWANAAFDYEERPFRFVYVLGVGATATIILAGIKALVDAKIAQGDPLFPISACAIVAGNVGLKFTAKLGYKFQIGLDGILKNATIEKDGVSNSIKGFIGAGLPAQIAAIEDEYSDMLGNQNRLYLTNKFFSAPAMTDSGTNYDTKIITWNMDNRNTQERTNINHQTLIVAIPDGAATFEVADFLTTMAAAFDFLTDALETGA